MATFVVPDIHGNRSALEALLEDVGLVKDGQRTTLGRQTTIVQLGDLANCVYDYREDYNSEQDDLSCLALVGHYPNWIDVFIPGNHEHPYFGGPPFHGFNFEHSVHEVLIDLQKRELLLPAWEAGGWLITHAGLTHSMGNLSRWEDASVAADVIKELWDGNPREQIFSAIGRTRGGWSPEGGILWADCEEPKWNKFPQLFGHTPGKKVRSNICEGMKVSPWYCIDLGGGKLKMPWGSWLAGAWIDDAGEIEIVEVDVTDG